MNVLVTGKDGQLGSELQALQSKSNLNFIFKSSKECDITDFGSIEKAVVKNDINAIINCAAYTAVDQAEDDTEKAMDINFVGTANLADISQKKNLKLIHISTDYVFDGNGKTPYKPTDNVSPIGIYGLSKRKGEETIINSQADAIIIRTSWLYSSFGNNFVKTMIRLGNERSELNVVADQIGSPTYARDLAATCIKILENNDPIAVNGKIYHFANEGAVSWCDLANAIFDELSIECEAKGIPSSEYPTKAKRPKYSVLDTTSLEKDFNIKIDNWRIALQRCLKEIIQAS